MAKQTWRKRVATAMAQQKNGGSYRKRVTVSTPIKLS
jgi:hypothetical protein